MKGALFVSGGVLIVLADLWFFSWLFRDVEMIAVWWGCAAVVTAIALALPGILLLAKGAAMIESGQ